MSIYRAYDIRGIYGEDLLDETAEDIGKAYATYSDAKKVAVGFDARLSSPALSEALIRGLTSSGVNVIDIGLVPTPVLYYAIISRELDGGIMVTGSHNPPEYNGFKLCVKDAASLYGPQITKIGEIIQKKDFKKGSGELQEEDVKADYLSFCEQNLKVEGHPKVVLDCGNGAAGVVAPELFHRLGCEVTELFSEPDGSFPNHPADPTEDENLGDLIQKVKEVEADVGLAFDGDGDRAGFVTEEGKIIRGDQALILFSRQILERHPKAKIIFEVKCTQGLLEDIKANGGQPIMYRTGHSFIKKKLKDSGALLAGEMSGHFYFADKYPGYDDGIYASARMVELFTGYGESMSQLVSSLPEFVSTPELKINVPEQRKFPLVEELVEYFKKQEGDFEVVDVDGVRIQHSTGWSLIRASNTTPTLVLRFEAKTEQDLVEIQNHLLSKLRQYPELEAELGALGL
ncbi:MAG: phosphomannomutase [Candidatus Altiarchaeales archaeon]|nr:phosphomannomutase [Candidatus Altiarchaeales archaeon]